MSALQRIMLFYKDYAIEIFKRWESTDIGLQVGSNGYCLKHMS